VNVLAQYGYTGQPINALNQASFGPTGWDRDTLLPFARRVEARAVEARRDLTPEQRRARPPWLDYDVPEGDQIVRFR